MAFCSAFDDLPDSADMAVDGGADGGVAAVAMEVDPHHREAKGKRRRVQSLATPLKR